MSTISIHHHSMPMAIAVTAVFAVVAVGTTVLSHDPASIQAPGVGSHPGTAHHFHHVATTSGGKVMRGY